MRGQDVVETRLKSVCAARREMMICLVDTLLNNDEDLFLARGGENHLLRLFPCGESRCLPPTASFSGGQGWWSGWPWLFAWGLCFTLARSFFDDRMVRNVNPEQFQRCSDRAPRPVMVLPWSVAHLSSSKLARPTKGRGERGKKRRRSLVQGLWQAISWESTLTSFTNQLMKPRLIGWKRSILAEWPSAERGQEVALAFNWGLEPEWYASLASSCTQGLCQETFNGIESVLW